MAISVKWIIEDGIKAGKTPKAILRILARQLPERKSALKHVRYYANRLVRIGELTSEVAVEKYGCSKGKGRQKKAPTKWQPVTRKTEKVEPIKKKRIRRTIKNPKRFTALKNKTK